MPIFSMIQGRTIVGAFAVISALSGCVSPQEAQYQDENTCARMGATYGSPSHTRCMLQQQQRRDDEMQRFTEQAYLNSEIARNAQEMRENRRRKRRDR